MVSYSGNREDVLLHRIFPEEDDGFYIDVGAGDPEAGSVTRHFYERGWHGVNIEPAVTQFRSLISQRERDINLNLGLSDKAGMMKFYELTGASWPFSTFSTGLAEGHRELGREYVEREVEVLTLAEVCERHAPREIAFISVDVEGHERQVIDGGDWKKFRPKVVIVESTRPGTAIPTHESWEPLLLSSDYVFAAFDGLNRYYIRSEDRHLVERLSTPVNVLDNFIPFEFNNQIRQLENSMIDLQGGWLAARALGIDLEERLKLARDPGRIPGLKTQTVATGRPLAVARPRPPLPLLVSAAKKLLRRG